MCIDGRIDHDRCHTDGTDGTGPHLNGVVGRDKAAVAGFGYSDGAMAQAGQAWTPDNLQAFLESPRDYMPGTKMGYSGMRDIGDRFSRNEVYVPEMLIAARAMKAGLALLKPLLVAEDTAPIRLVALPFQHQGTHELDYVANGMAEAITAYLSGMDGLQVIALKSALTYVGTEKTPAEIGAELDVDYIYRQSLATDIKLLLQTIPAVVLGRGAY